MATHRPVGPKVPMAVIRPVGPKDFGATHRPVGARDVSPGQRPGFQGRPPFPPPRRGEGFHGNASPRRGEEIQWAAVHRLGHMGTIKILGPRSPGASPRADIPCPFGAMDRPKGAKNSGVVHAPLGGQRFWGQRIAPKGRGIPAQGNALGFRAVPHFTAPKGRRTATPNAAPARASTGPIG